MSDEELIREGKNGRYLCSPMAKFGKPPRKFCVVQFEELKAEGRRRQSKNRITMAQPHRNDDFGIAITKNDAIKS
jgi:hypothetical protein